MKRVILTLSIMLMAFVGFSQIDFTVDSDKPTIDIQRPTFSENSNITPGIQLENGAFALDDDDASYSTMVRFSLGERVELRTTTNWDSNLNLGFKVNVFNSEEKWMPDVAVISSFNLNGLSNSTVSDYRVVADFDDMVDKLGVTFNYGKGDLFNYDLINRAGMQNYFNTVARYQVLDRLGAFGEVQVIDEDLNYNVGFTVLANNNWVFDVHGGSISDENGEDSTLPFFGGGLSFLVR